MTAGALIFAHNNDHIDYVSMANWSAKNIQRHLGIPVKIITEHDNQEINARWFSDYGQSMSWHNQSRVTAYDVTPWDRTLVLDADYVVASDQLSTVLASTQDFLCFRHAYDVTGLDDFVELDTFGDTHMPMWWATVMCFSKTPRARLIFDAMHMIKNNWAHYRKIYKIRQTTYRNDHALSIALCLVHGHTLDIPAIPWSMASLTPEHRLQQLEQDCYRVDFEKPGKKSRWTQLQGQDFHAMGKQQLGDIVASQT